MFQLHVDIHVNLLVALLGQFCTITGKLSTATGAGAPLSPIVPFRKSSEKQAHPYLTERSLGNGGVFRRF